MLPKRAYTITGTIFILIGFIIMLNSFQGLTGFVIIEDFNIKAGYIIGIWFIIAGIITLILGRSIEHYKFRGRESLREHNRQAYTTARRAYRTEHHRNPSMKELRRFIRQHHEQGDLSEMVEEARHHE